MAFSSSLPFENLLGMHMQHQEILEIHLREEEIWNRLRLASIIVGFAACIDVQVHPDNDFLIAQVLPDTPVMPDNRLIGTVPDSTRDECQGNPVFPEKTVQFLKIHVLGLPLTDNCHNL